jgi:hypothetical protein
MEMEGEGISAAQGRAGRAAGCSRWIAAPQSSLSVTAAMPLPRATVTNQHFDDEKSSFYI